MPEPRPGGPLAGSEGSNPKQQAGLHDDELLVESYPFEFVLGVLREDLPEVHDGRRWALAERLVAAVRGAGGERGQREWTLEGDFRATYVVEGPKLDDGERVRVSGAVPSEPQEEKLRTALEHIRDGTTDCEPAVFARAALSAVPLLQDGGQDG